eukprot:4574335-Amphidinium_carterae.1
MTARLRVVTCQQLHCSCCRLSHAWKKTSFVDAQSCFHFFDERIWFACVREGKLLMDHVTDGTLLAAGSQLLHRQVGNGGLASDKLDIGVFMTLDQFTDMATSLDFHKMQLNS